MSVTTTDMTATPVLQYICMLAHKIQLFQAPIGTKYDIAHMQIKNTTNYRIKTKPHLLLHVSQLVLFHSFVTSTLPNYLLETVNKLAVKLTNKTNYLHSIFGIGNIHRDRNIDLLAETWHSMANKKYPKIF